MKLDAVIRREPSFLECRFSGDRKAWCNDQSDKNRLQDCFHNTHGQFPPSGSVRRFEGTACNCKEYHECRPAQPDRIKERLRDAESIAEAEQRPTIQVKQKSQSAGRCLMYPLHTLDKAAV